MSQATEIVPTSLDGSASGAALLIPLACRLTSRLDWPPSTLQRHRRDFVLLSARTEVVSVVAAEFPRDRPSLNLNLGEDPNLSLCPLFQFAGCHKKTESCASRQNTFLLNPLKLRLKSALPSHCSKVLNQQWQFKN